MGIPSAFTQALKFSCAGYILSAVLAVFLQMEYKSEVTMGKFIAEQMIIYNGIFVVFLCWELSHHLHQVSFLMPYASLSLLGTWFVESMNINVIM